MVTGLANVLRRSGRFAMPSRRFGRIERAQARAAGVSPFVSPPPVHFPSDPNSIVQVNVTTTIAPTPNTYQQTGAFVSFGGSTLAPNTCQELTVFSDLADYTVPPMQIANATWATGEATYTTTAALPSEMGVGETFNLSITGCNPSGYNVSNAAATVTTTHAFTVPIATNPGTWVAPVGNVTPQAMLTVSVELSQMASSFFDQGNAISVYILELGPGVTMADNVTNLGSWLTKNPRSFYGYLMPRECANSVANYTAWIPLLQQYQADTAMTYFWFTVLPAVNPSAPDQDPLTLLNSSGADYKDVIQMVESPSTLQSPNAGNPLGEFSMAAMFYNAMAFSPSNINRCRPMSFRLLAGVTPYPTQNNATALEGFKAASTNYVASGTEGGIDFAMVYQGVNLDGTDYFNWWWIIDYAQIIINQNLSNAIINGSNNPTNPLYYNQGGIDRLESNVSSSMAQMQAFGMIVGNIIMTSYDQDTLAQAIQNGDFTAACNVNAVPFITYSASNPTHYRIGEYDGLSTYFIPLQGFVHVIVNINASQLVVG